MPSQRSLAPLLLFGVLIAAACGAGDDDADDADPVGQTPTLDTAAAPLLTMPISRFALSLDDLPDGYLTDRESTFHLDSTNYGATPIFDGPDVGKAMLESWGYLGGYETAFEPEQRMTAVLDGAYYAAVEVHLFKDAAGAATAQGYFEEKLAGNSEVVSAGQVGNDSSAWKLTRDTIPGSSIPAAYHRVLFRRGNMVGVVQTYGSDVLMTMDVAHALAVAVDEKAMGARVAVEPTPLGQPGTPTPAQ